ncbi:MAG: hypothetical protein LAP87_25275 [Acidobacteriia bacterium]|nr:hypothetical protein [Terriglobia bacterium]
MLKSRFSAFLSLLLVFLSGGVVGAFAYRMYNATVVAAPGSRRPDPEEVRKRLVTEMRERVKLDEQQVGQLEKIYDQTREQFNLLNEKRNVESHALWDSQTEKIKAILRPDQMPLFEALHAEHEQARKRRHDLQHQGEKK